MHSNEEKWSQQNNLLISIVFSGLIILAFQNLGLSSQSELTNQFGINPESKRILILANALVFLVYKLIFSSIRHCCLFTRINSTGISIRHNIAIYDNAHETGSYEITKDDPIGDYGSQGKSFPKKTTLI